MLAAVRKRRPYPFDTDPEAQIFHNRMVDCVWQELHERRIDSALHHEDDELERTRILQMLPANKARLHVSKRSDLLAVVDDHAWHGDIVRIPLSWWKAAATSPALDMPITQWANICLRLNRIERRLRKGREHCRTVEDSALRDRVRLGIEILEDSLAAERINAEIWEAEINAAIAGCQSPTLARRPSADDRAREWLDEAE